MSVLSTIRFRTIFLFYVAAHLRQYEAETETHPKSNITNGFGENSAGGEFDNRVVSGMATIHSERVGFRANLLCSQSLFASAEDRKATII